MSAKSTENKSSFFIQIVVPSALAVVLFIVTLFYYVIPAFESTLLERKREMIMELTNAATSILDKYHNEEKSGILNREEAQRTAISRIEYLRYGDENKDYFWITDTIPIMVMHPYRPDLNKKELSDYSDSHGKKLFLEFVKVAKKDKHGFVDYMWQWKDDSTHIVPKLSYVNAFEPWGWVIGTGIYIEDVKKEIAGLTQKFIRISIIISLITALVLFYIARQSHRIEKKRRKAENELNESRERYKSLVESSTEGLLMIMDRKIIFTNSILQKMTGISSEEIMTMFLTDLVNIPPEIVDQLIIKKNNIDFKTLETQLITKEGKSLSVLLSISPVVFNDKDAVVFSLKDISFDKQIKEELFHNKEKFKALMDKLNLGIFRTTLDFKGRFLEANETALKMLGYKIFEDITTVYILDLFIDAEDKRYFRQNLIEKGFVKKQMVKLRKKNGQTVIFSVSLVIILNNDNVPVFCDGIIEEAGYQKNTSDYSEGVLNDFVVFSQLFYQPVRNFSRPLLTCNYDDSLRSLNTKMNKASADMALIISSNSEPLGFITESDFKSRAFKEASFFDKKAFEIMTAPINSINEDDLLLEALFLMNNNNLSHLVVKTSEGAYSGQVSYKNLFVLNSFYVANTVYQIEKTSDLDVLKSIRLSFVNALIPMIESNLAPTTVFKSLAILSDTITKRIIEIIIDEIGKPPADFCFISLGSDARKEQTLSTDQDNALIFENVDKSKETEAHTYFNTFGEKVCTALNHVGYNLCKGQIMAMNKKWCQPLGVWKENFSRWINKSNPKDLLEINIFFDIRPIYGNESFVDDLHKHVFTESKKKPSYLYHLAQNTQLLKPQVGFWGNILLETAGAPPETVNIKEAILPIVNFARIYALKNQYNETGTWKRLKHLNKIGVLTDDSFNNTMQALDYLNQMRLKHQVGLFKSGLKPDNLLNTKKLSELDKSIIKKVLSNISNILSKLSFDFRGGA